MSKAKSKYRLFMFFFLDFAVGSPYDGPNGKGAVYIFHGSDAEIRSKPAQVGILILMKPTIFDHRWQEK